VNGHLAEVSLWFMYVSKNNNYLKYLCDVSRENSARVAFDSETKKKRMTWAYASNK